MSSDATVAVSVKDIAVDSSEEKNASDEKSSAEISSPMVPFSKLFRFYGPTEQLMLGFGLLCCAIGGASFPCINIAFGE
ncbi:hypothetical protein N9L76_10510, partial [bacterium]|nr:hypothetical protein [bacterium]